MPSPSLINRLENLQKDLEEYRSQFIEGEFVMLDAQAKLLRDDIRCFIYLYNFFYLGDK